VARSSARQRRRPGHSPGNAGDNADSDPAGDTPVAPTPRSRHLSRARPLQRPSSPAPTAAPTPGRLRLTCARRHRSFPKVSDLRQPATVGAPRRAHPPNPASGQFLPGTPKPTSATGRRSQSSAKPLLTTETTRVLRPPIKALLDGDRPGALPRLAPVTPPTETTGAPDLVDCDNSPPGPTIFSSVRAPASNSSTTSSGSLRRISSGSDPGSQAGAPPVRLTASRRRPEDQRLSLKLGFCFWLKA